MLLELKCVFLVNFIIRLQIMPTQLFHILNVMSESMSRTLYTEV